MAAVLAAALADAVTLAVSVAAAAAVAAALLLLHGCMNHDVVISHLFSCVKWAGRQRYK